MKHLSSQHYPNTADWCYHRGVKFYYKRMKDSGMTLKQIGDYVGVSATRVSQQIIKCKKYKKEPYFETRDVYAEFKAHYDEVMG